MLSPFKRDTATSVTAELLVTIRDSNATEFSFPRPASLKLAELPTTPSKTQDTSLLQTAPSWP